MNKKYRLSNETPGLFSTTAIVEIEETINACLQAVEGANNPRLVILETWFVIDWLMRQIYISGIDCDKYKTEKFYPHYQILPNSFKECLDSLHEFIKAQTELPEKSPQDIDDLHGSFSLISYIDKKIPKEFKKVLEVVEQYKREKYHISKNNIFTSDPSNSRISILGDTNNRYRAVTTSWLDSVKTLQDEWYTTATKLNTARNKAAHRIEENSIYDVFGIKGRNKLELLKKTCFKTLKSLAGVVEHTE